MLRRKLDAEAREYEHKLDEVQHELNAADDFMHKMEDKIKAAKIAAAESYQNIVSGLRDRIRRLKGLGSR